MSHLQTQKSLPQLPPRAGGRLRPESNFFSSTAPLQINRVCPADRAGRRDRYSIYIEAQCSSEPPASGKERAEDRTGAKSAICPSPCHRQGDGQSPSSARVIPPKLVKIQSKPVSAGRCFRTGSIASNRLPLSCKMQQRLPAPQKKGVVLQGNVSTADLASLAESLL